MNIAIENSSFTLPRTILGVLVCVLLSYAPLLIAEEKNQDQTEIKTQATESASTAEKSSDEEKIASNTSTDNIDQKKNDIPVAEEIVKKEITKEKIINEEKTNQVSVKEIATDNNNNDITKTEDDPLLKACKETKTGESVTVEGVSIVCHGEENEKSTFDFQAAEPVEEPSNGFVGFSDRYLNDFYLVTGMGYANYASMVSYADLDRTKGFINDRYGYTDTNASGIAHGFDATVGLGYIANKYILIELGYSYLGSTGISGTTSDTDGINILNYSSSATMSSFDFSTIARYRLNDLVVLPITNTIHVMAIIETHQWKRVTTFQLPEDNISGTTSGFGFSLGLGGDYQVNKFLTIRSVWQYKTIVDEGINTVMVSMVMKNNTRYAQAIQNSIINPIKNLW